MTRKTNKKERAHRQSQVVACESKQEAEFGLQHVMMFTYGTHTAMIFAVSSCSGRT